MHVFKTSIVAALFAVSSCGMRREPAVVIDSWRAVAYAKGSCRAARLSCPDADNPGGVKDYIGSLKAQFAAAPVCRGVRVVEWFGPNVPTPKDMPRHREVLNVDYHPYETVQSFHITGEPFDGISGSGTVEEIAKRACAAARGLGAKVE